MTDDAGACMLVDGLGLQFTRVSTDLNALAQYDPDWWALGKICAYHLQTEPFVHLDTDVFLQYLLAAFVEYYKASAVSPFGSVRIEYLFNSMADPWNLECAAQAGFTHLVADAKRNPLFADRLERMIQRDYPDHYERCICAKMKTLPTGQGLVVKHELVLRS